MALGAAGAAVPVARELLDDAAVRMGIRASAEKRATGDPSSVGLLLGAAGGLIAAILTAPKAGREMRDELAVTAKDAATRAREVASTSARRSRPAPARPPNWPASGSRSSSGPRPKELNGEPIVEPIVDAIQAPEVTPPAATRKRAPRPSPSTRSSRPCSTRTSPPRGRPRAGLSVSSRSYGALVRRLGTAARSPLRRPPGRPRRPPARRPAWRGTWTVALERRPRPARPPPSPLASGFASLLGAGAAPLMVPPWRRGCGRDPVAAWRPAPASAGAASAGLRPRLGLGAAAASSSAGSSVSRGRVSPDRREAGRARPASPHRPPRRSTRAPLRHRSCRACEMSSSSVQPISPRRRSRRQLAVTSSVRPRPRPRPRPPRRRRRRRASPVAASVVPSAARAAPRAAPRCREPWRRDRLGPRPRCVPRPRAAGLAPPSRIAARAAAATAAGASRKPNSGTTSLAGIAGALMPLLGLVGILAAADAGDLHDVDELVGDRDEVRRRVRPEADHLAADALVLEGADGGSEVPVAGDDHGDVHPIGEAEQVDHQLDVQVGLDAAVAELADVLVNDLVAVLAQEVDELALVLVLRVEPGIGVGANQVAPLGGGLSRAT